MGRFLLQHIDLRMTGWWRSRLPGLIRWRSAWMPVRLPGTTIFDAEQSRKGYWLNQFCTSLMKAENRERFKADERAYLDEWPMSEAQKRAVMARRSNWAR